MRTLRLEFLAVAWLLPIVASPVHAGPPRIADHKPRSAGATTNSLSIAVTQANAAQIAEALDMPGTTNAVTTGGATQLGTFSEASGVLGLYSGVILSTGDAADVSGSNTAGGISGQMAQPGDTDLAQFIGTNHDAASFECDFSCTVQSLLTLRFIFGSEEYNEWINSSYNDLFACFLDGHAIANNIAHVPGSSQRISVNGVNCGGALRDHVPPGPGVNCALYRNNDISGALAPLGELDGMSKVLVNEVLVAPGTHHIKFVIADNGDDRYDSAVFIAAVSVCSTYVQITQQPQPTLYTAAGGATLTVAATGPGPATYQWRKHDPTPVNLEDGDSYSGTQTATLALAPSNFCLTGTYDCVITNSCGDQVTQTALVYCDQLPAILSEPQDVTVYTGTPEVELTVGIPPFFPLCLGNTYAWQDATNMVSLDDGEDYLGTKTRTLTIIDPEGPSVTDYFCEITNQCGSILTRLARVTVLVPPPPAPRIATLDWLHDAFPFNETPGLAGTAVFDTTTALLKSGRNIAQLTGDENRFDIPGDTLVVCECHGSVRADLVFRILPGPGNYTTVGSTNSGLRRVPTSPVMATPGDGSFWGQYLADNGTFGSPGGHSAGRWDPNVWNSARMDTAEINLWPISGRQYFSERDSCRWAGTYHESDPKFATLGIAKSRCFLRSPTGPFDSSNITCDRVGDPTDGWETAGGGYVQEGALPSGQTFEYTKIIPDGQLTPGTHVEYFIRVSHIAYPTSFSMTPDTNLVTPQPNEIVSNTDACGSVSGPGATDGHRWQQFSVLPDRWKAVNYGGLGMACMLYIDMDDGLGDERAWVTAADLIGATWPTKWGAHNGWHIDHLADDPNDPANFVRAHGGQPGTSWDMYGVRGVIDPIRGCAGSIGDRLSNRASMGLAADKYSRLGPTPEMLRAYYKVLYITTGRFDRQILGPFNDRSQNDVAILSNYWAQSSFTSCGALVEGESFAESELAAGIQHSILVKTLFGTNTALPSYTLATAPAYLACPDVLQNVGSLGTYGVQNVLLPDNDVLTKTNFAYTQDASFFQNIGTSGPYVASTLTLPHVTGSVPVNWTGMLDAWDVQDFGTRFCAPPGNGRVSYLHDVFKNIFGDICGIVGPNPLVGVDPTIAATVQSPGLRVLGNPTSGGRVHLALRVPARGPIQVTVCDIAGRRLRNIVDETREAGSYTILWDTRDEQGQSVRPGLYFVRARLPGASDELTRSVVVLR